MRGLPAMICAALLVGSAAGAQTYHPAFDPRAHKGPRTGHLDELMVLGTPHLSEFPKGFDPAVLSGVLDRLAAWRPQAIAIEAVSGAQCDFMRHYPARYSDSVGDYCWDPAPARAATGLDVPAATAAADRLLATWPKAPTPDQRRRLAALFLASGDGASALVQWLRLPETERKQGDGLDAALVARLDTLRTRHDESLLIAAALAARLGLERVYPIDDHTADAPVADEKAYGEAIGRAWDNPATAKRRAMDAELSQHADSAANVLAMYRAYNAPDMGELVFRSDFGAALEEPSPQAFGRGYVAYWETRNLRMAANIRDMLSQKPGMRALVIVGASHKPYLEAYLDGMHDVSIADAERVLR